MRGGRRAGGARGRAAGLSAWLDVETSGGVAVTLRLAARGQRRGGSAGKGEQEKERPVMANALRVHRGYSSGGRPYKGRMCE